MITSIKAKTIALFIILILVVSIVFSLTAIKTSSPKTNYTIVIDAGHGGMDGGSIGHSGTVESEINLEYAYALKNMFETINVNVVMTRKNKNGLYSILSSNKKKDDMLKRKEIICKANPSLVISIHMNSFPLKSCKGSQVFYKQTDMVSESLAGHIQDYLVKNIVNSRKNCEEGDYYILNCTKYPSVLVECGFISNPEEEAMLKSEEHREKIVYSIFCGVIAFLGS